MNLKYLQSRHISRTDEGRTVAEVETPNGEKFPLSAEMLASCKVLEHGNYTWSKLRVTIELEIEFLGGVAATKDYFARALLAEIVRLRAQAEKDSSSARDAWTKVSELQAELRAAAVVESALIATGKQS